MGLAEWSLKNRTSTFVLTALLLFGGLAAYNNLSRLEDPEFTIKEALVITQYPGATAREVEEEVSDLIETAVQQLGQLKEVESRSTPGLSVVTVRIKDQYTRDDLPQIWDETRRKVGDVQGELPPGAGPSIVNDDYGDVWGVFFALYSDDRGFGPEYSYAELKEYAKLLRRELLLVEDVAKVELWGTRTEAVYIVPNRERMAQLGVTPDLIINRLVDKNVVTDAGRVKVGQRFLQIQPTGNFDAVQDMESLLITSQGASRQIYLRDFADVRRGYVEPSNNALRYDGRPAIGFGISTVSGGNVVTMGEAIEKRVRELRGQTPLGIEFGVVSLQSEAVTVAISGFVNSLMQAVAIVIGVLLIFMGLRSGVIIGAVLVITICGSFIFMSFWGVALERISLGALIIALGMLVDNAIVVVDGILVGMQRGKKPEQAALDVTRQTGIPLLGATAVAIMAFAAIGLSDDSTGEFCRSLFQVVLISLGLSWVTAMTITPVLGVMFLKPPRTKPGEAPKDPFDSGLYRGYRRLLVSAMRHRVVTIGLVLAVFATSLYGFGYVDRSFFPPSTRPQFMVDTWLPMGTHIDDTMAFASEAEDYFRTLEGVRHVTTLGGQGGLRFLLTYAPEKVDSSYVQFLIDVDDTRRIEDMIKTIEHDLQARYPDALVGGKKFLLGPGDGGKIQIRFRGNDLDALRALADQAMVIGQQEGGKTVRLDWRERVARVRPVLAEEQSNLAGVEPSDLSRQVMASFEGLAVGFYRESDELLPIIVRAEEAERTDVSSMRDLQIWSPAAGRYIPLRQVVQRFDTDFENQIIMRLNRRPTATVHMDPVGDEPASVLLARVMPEVAALPLPDGTNLEWWGEFRNSKRGQAGIAATAPYFFLGMVVIVILLFNALRQPLVIWLTVPLAIIGVTAGLLATGQPFGFMALLGFMSLSGMLIKNAVVLVDEVELEKREGKEVYDAIVSSGISRLRPVAMAALTTALGMIPLLFDAFFKAMAVTIIGGLMVATVLTMVVVPVLYAIFFRAREPGTA